MTRYIAIAEETLPVDFTGVVWQPWINVLDQDVELLPAMAARKHIRERGGLGEATRLKLFVCVSTQHPAVSVNYVEFNIWPE